MCITACQSADVRKPLWFKPKVEDLPVEAEGRFVEGVSLGKLKAEIEGGWGLLADINCVASFTTFLILEDNL